MNKEESRISKETIKFVNKAYEKLSILHCSRSNMRYFNYDTDIDTNIDKIFELLDEIYHKSIEKKVSLKPIKVKKINKINKIKKIKKINKIVVVEEDYPSTDTSSDTSSDYSSAYDSESIIGSTVIYSSSDESDDSEEESEEDLGKILTDWVLHDEQFSQSVEISPWNTNSFEE